jgi:hypothetical protein
MAYAEALRVVSLIAILALAELSLLTWPVLALLGLIGACGTVAYSVAAPLLVPALVPSRTLATANPRIELARTLAYAAGPASGAHSSAGPVPRLRSVLPPCSLLVQWFCWLA